MVARKDMKERIPAISNEFYPVILRRNEIQNTLLSRFKIYRLRASQMNLLNLLFVRSKL